jgi:D-3-phosphoglycerate dehydrogenase
MRILALDGIHADGLKLFTDAGYDVEVRRSDQGSEAARPALEGVDAVLVRSATSVTARGARERTQLKVIGRAGAGVDTIDVDAATARGIAVMNAPDGNTPGRRRTRGVAAVRAGRGTSRARMPA